MIMLFLWLLTYFLWTQTKYMYYINKREIILCKFDFYVSDWFWFHVMIGCLLTKGRGDFFIPMIRRF
jgi:hypothetical protein